MAGGGSSDRAAAAPNLQIGAAPGSSAPPVSVPPPPAAMAGRLRSMARSGGVRGGGVYALVAAANRNMRDMHERSGSDGNVPARGGVPPPAPPVQQQPAVVQFVAPAAAVMGCTVPLYCFICDRADHNMSQCQALKAPRPSATLCGYGPERSAILQIPDSLWRGELSSPTAVVTVTGGKPTASVVEDVIRRIVPVPSSWRWEAIPHGDNAFLVSFPSLEDLQRVTNYEVRLKSHGVALDFSEWNGEEIADVHVVWVHVEGVPHSLHHFLGLWAVGSVIGSTQDVDLLCLRRRGIVRVQVAVLSKEVFPLGTRVVVKNKGFMLQYSLEKEDFKADDDFVPKVWDISDGRKDRSRERGDENDCNGAIKRIKNENSDSGL